MFDFDTETGEIWLYDTIGPAWAGMIDAESLHGALKEIGNRDLTLRISSPGGSVFDAVDMFNMIKRHASAVIAEVDGIAASAASFLMLAADEVRAAKNSTFMVHEAMTMTFGNKAEHQKSIEVLETIDANILGMYSDKTGKTTNEIAKLLEAETWMTADQALEFGLIDSIIDEERDAPVTVPEGMYQKTPDALLRKPEAGAKTKFFPKRMAAKARGVTLCQR